MGSKQQEIPTLQPENALALWRKGKDAWNLWVEQHPEYHIDFSNVDFSLEMNDAQAAISFNGYIFPKGDMDFSNTQFGEGDVDFSDTQFGEGDVDFSNAQFGDGDVYFSNAQFGEGDVDFSNAQFGDGDVYFFEAQFSEGYVAFINTRFADGYADFSNAQFGESDINFTNAQFGEGNVNFSDAHFGESNVSFFVTKFDKGNVSFSQTQFGAGNVNFFFVQFGEGDVDFSGAQFGDGVVGFTGAQFGEGEADFSRIQFGDGDVNFSGAKFDRSKANFIYAQFGEGNVDFSEAQFGEGDVNFSKVRFGKGEVDFSNTQFSMGHVAFTEAQFGEGNVNFSEAKFGNGSVDMRYILAKGHFDISELRQPEDISQLSFKGAEFCKTFSLSNNRFDCVVDLTSTKMSHHVDLDDVYCKLPRENTSFWNFLTIKKAQNEKDTHAFRRLKELSESNKHHESALEFHAQELRAKRWQLGVSRRESLLDLIYDKLSNYGRSVTTPLSWLVFGVWPFFAFLYYCISYWEIGFSWQWAKECLSFSAGQLLPIIPGARFAQTEGVANLFQGDLPFSVTLLTFAETIISLMLIFLVGLALRNRFRV